MAVIEAYLSAFTTALQNRFPRLLYIDVFSGSGAREIFHEATVANLLEPDREAWIEERRGSARIALEARPSFIELTFIENKKAFCHALEKLAARYPGRDVRIVRGEANEKVLEAIRRPSWTGTRAVMFIDPYGMQMRWHTIEAIAQTQAIDVWYLVSFQGLYRQATVLRRDITPKKRDALNRMLGSESWESAWYAAADRDDLFGFASETAHLSETRTASIDQMQEYVRDRLKSVFPYVSPEPLRLKTANGAPGFALFFACSNPKPAAFGLAAKIASHILKAGNSSQ